MITINPKKESGKVYIASYKDGRTAKDVAKTLRKSGFTVIVKKDGYIWYTIARI